MPSHLALILISSFVLFLWLFERKQAKGVSPATWVPTLWLMYCASKPLAVWLGAESAGGIESGSSLDRNFLVLLIFVGIFILLPRPVDWRAVWAGNVWLFFIMSYALLSIAWSDYPFVSVKRYIRLTGSVIMSLVILSEAEPRLAFESVLRRTIFALVPFSLLLIKYYPDLGVMYGRISGDIMWVGVATQKNSLGVLCMVALFFLFWRAFRIWSTEGMRAARSKSWPDLVVAVMAAFMLRGPSNAAASKTSFVVLTIGCFCMWWLHHVTSQGRIVPRSTVLTVTVLLFFYGVGIPFGLNSLFSGVLSLLGRDTTFTGRTEIWDELIPIAMQSPVLGCGYGGFWVLPIESGVNEAHNGYLDVMIELGIIGIFLVFGFLVSTARAAHATLSHEFWWPCFCLGFLLIALLHNASESTFLKTSDFLWTILLIASMIFKLQDTPAICATNDMPQVSWLGRV